MPNSPPDRFVLKNVKNCQKASPASPLEISSVSIFFYWGFYNNYFFEKSPKNFENFGEAIFFTGVFIIITLEKLETLEISREADI